jgi:hypothetical protein
MRDESRSSWVVRPSNRIGSAGMSRNRRFTCSRAGGDKRREIEAISAPHVNDSASADHTEACKTVVQAATYSTGLSVRVH